MQPDVERLIRENERLKATLRSVEQYARAATFGGWRHAIVALCQGGK